MKLANLFTTLLLTVFLLAGCESGHEHSYSGFLEGVGDAEPVQNSYSGKRPSIQVSNPHDITVVVYTHGTRNPRQRENCAGWSNQVPPSLLELHGGEVLIYYHCSGATDSPYSMSSAGNWIYERIEELSAVVDELHDAGIPSENIFLAGHSAGGWSALMSAREFGSHFNGVIAFGPAFAGRRSEDERYPHWRQEIRPRQIEQMLEAEGIRALVFAYEDDAFNRPQDLTFLTDAYPTSVQLVGYTCGSGHVTHIRDCRQEQTTEAILEFIGRR